MALTTEEAAVNTAVDTLIAAWEAMVDAKTQGNQIQCVPIKIEQAGLPHKRWGNDAGAIQWDFARKQIFTRELTTADRFPISVGIYPLFFKMTNAAGDLT